VRDIISDVGLAVCMVVILFELFIRRSLSLRDLTASFAAALLAGLFLALRNDEWIRGAGIGVTSGILVVFALRARSADRSTDRSRKTPQPRAVTVSLWIEAIFALAAAVTFVFGNLGVALILLGVCLLAVSAEVTVGGRRRSSRQ
jgi:hypothetical protein